LLLLPLCGGRKAEGGGGYILKAMEEAGPADGGG